MLQMPSSERWKPLRSGLVDMFYYDAEEFWFHDLLERSGAHHA